MCNIPNFNVRRRRRDQVLTGDELDCKYYLRLQEREYSEKACTLGSKPTVGGIEMVGDFAYLVTSTSETENLGIECPGYGPREIVFSKSVLLEEVPNGCTLTTDNVRFRTRHPDRPTVFFKTVVHDIFKDINATVNYDVFGTKSDEVSHPGS